MQMYQTLVDTAKRGSGLMLVVAAIVLTAHPPLTLAGAGPTVDFSRLNARQRSLFGTYVKSHPTAKWDGLSASEQVEFAGATQALDDWWQFEPNAQPRPQPGADQIASIDEIHGQIANASSASQYNLEVKWGAGAKVAFQHAWEWGQHFSILHPGEGGYQQNKNGDPFLGIVVLFGDTDPRQGQFHIGFRGFPGHYFADNGNIAKNYASYCSWYGEIKGYASCPTGSAVIAFLPFWEASR